MSGKNEYTTFQEALKKVLSVPHEVIKAKLKAEKKRPKRASSRASHATS
jgi:hypothetical protein